jgi:hypothetical protein
LKGGAFREVQPALGCGESGTSADNESVYTSRFTHGHNHLERLPARLGIAQKNGHPGMVATMLR